MCQANVESRQLDLDSDKYLPVFFATELMSAALNGQYPAKQRKVHLIEPDIMVNVMKTAPENREESL
jgi:hypothetical protein